MDFESWWKKKTKRAGMNEGKFIFAICKSLARHAWDDSRENLREYQKHEFCRTVECENLQKSCVVDSPVLCSFSAKEFHKFLQERGPIIVKGDK